MKYDIFISYKRKSLATANNLYYRLTTRGYSTFFDLEEMRMDNFDTQLLKYIEEANDVFVLLEQGSLDACFTKEWEKDWFCHEISYALAKGKNIIPILLNGYQMPKIDGLPKEIQDITRKNAIEFSFTYFNEYLDRLVDKGYITSIPNKEQKISSVFKFYSNENCQVLKEGKMVCSLEGNSEEPFYLPVNRKGTYRFKCVNNITQEEKLVKETIDFDEEKEIDIEWSSSRKPLLPEYEFLKSNLIEGEEYVVNLGPVSLNMIRVEGENLKIGATKEQLLDADNIEYPEHEISLDSFYISQFPITQNMWEIVMGYNKSKFRELESKLENDTLGKSLGVRTGAIFPYATTLRNIIGAQTGAIMTPSLLNKILLHGKREKGHYPVENISHDEAVEFVKRLSRMTNLHFSLPSEEEWEYAARGGQKSKGFRFSGSDDINEVAWNRDNSEGTTHPVGEKKPNELNIFDMSGNVWEWTETIARSYSDNSDDISGDIFIRRGGSWWHEAENCRVSKRYASNKSKKTSGLGLRVVVRINQ